MLSLKLWIRMGEEGARLAQAKAQLPEKPLALTHPQADAISLLDPRRQGLPIPDLSLQASVFWTAAHSLSDLIELLAIEPPRSAWPRRIDQARQALLVEAMDPILDGARRIAQQMAHFTATHTLGHQQQAVQPVVVSRFLRTTDLVLQRQDHGLGIRNLEFPHAKRVPSPTAMRNYL
jgi:hypothetical protein